jgi:hypothetical protein
MSAAGDKTDRPTRGSCLCGAVAYEISAHMGLFQYCRCSRCRKASGSAFGAGLFVKPEHFRWLQGEEHVGRYEVPEAAHYATSFCRVCGSSLPWLTKTGRVVAVPAGTLDDDPGIRPSQSIFCASAADWYVEPAELPRYDELPPKRESK